VCNTIGEMFLVCGSYKLEFRKCLYSWSTWRLALENVEQSQSSCVIIGLGQERYAEKPITYIPLQVSIYYSMIIGEFETRYILRVRFMHIQKDRWMDIC